MTSRWTADTDCTAANRRVHYVVLTSCGHKQRQGLQSQALLFIRFSRMLRIATEIEPASTPQGFNALIQRRVSHEQSCKTVAAGDAESGDLFRQGGLFVIDLQPLQRGDHLLPPGQARAARIGAELALAREPHHDDAGQYAQHQLRDDFRGKRAHARAAALVFLSSTRSTK